MERDTFLSLPAGEVAALVRNAGPKVCVFPINGTRRWFMLEHPPTDSDADWLASYLSIIETRHIELYRLIFDHGIEYLLTPAFGPDLMERSDAYIQIAAQGLARLATHEIFLNFYADYDVRVRFYGDYRKYFSGTPYEYLSDLFDEVTVRTQAHSRFRLFFGLFGNDAAETIGELAIQHFQAHGQAPDKRALVEAYYGEYVPPVSFFIGFDKFAAFDMPLVATGEEDLYFTVSPSPYLTPRQLREILYDHLYTRRGQEADYDTLEPDAWMLMREFYRANRDHTLGVGAIQTRGGYWYPLPQIALPPNFAVKKP